VNGKLDQVLYYASVVLENLETKEILNPYLKVYSVNIAEPMNSTRLCNDSLISDN